MQEPVHGLVRELVPGGAGPTRGPGRRDRQDPAGVRTARAVDAMLSGLPGHERPTAALQSVARSALETSAAAMGHEPGTRADAVIRALRDTKWDLFDRVARLEDERQAEARDLLQTLRKALEADEYVKALEPHLEEARDHGHPAAGARGRSSSRAGRRLTAAGTTITGRDPEGRAGQARGDARRGRRPVPPGPELDTRAGGVALMAAPPLKPYQLQHEIGRVCQKDSDPDAMVIGLHAPGDWQGDGELIVDDRRFAVVRADTVLEFREALAGAEADRSADGRADRAGSGRAGPRRRRPPGPGQALRRIDVWEGVKGLFRARQLDPALRETCLAQRPAGTRAPGSRLRPGPGRRARCRHGLAGDLPPRPRAWRTASPTSPGLLRWAADHRRRADIARPRPTSARPPGPAWRDARAGRRSRSSTSSSPGPAATPWPWPIACEVVFAERRGRRAGPAGRRRPAGAVPLHRPIEPGDRADLARAAPTRSTTSPAPTPTQPRPTCSAPTALLREVRAAPLAHIGSRTPLAWEARLRRFADGR